VKSFDFVAIGSGNTGLASAYRVARAGKRVAVAEKGEPGGLCSLAGCNPKKVFVRAVEVLDLARRSAEHGVHVGAISVDWSRVAQRKRSFTDPVPSETEESLRRRGIELLRGTARFLSGEAIEVDGEQVRADGFAVATGSRPRTLLFPGAELVRTTDDILGLREIPRRLAIIGSGVVAFEFAHVFSRLGTAVTILQHRDRALSEFDADFVEPILVFTRSLGVDFLENARVESVREVHGALHLQIAGARSLTADFVLNAAGRMAALESLDLGKAGVETDEDGLVVDRYLRSPGNRRVFGGGDAHGRFQLSPVASYEGRVIARNFLGGEVEAADYTTIPQAVFTIPPVAMVGMTEAAARATGLDVRVAVNEMKDWKVFRIAGEPVARAKVVAEAGTGRLRGAQLFCAEAPELIPIFALAIRHGVTVAEFRNMVFPYPTFASALESALPEV
jgi:glutathione reductase (NADPH)